MQASHISDRGLLRTLRWKTWPLLQEYKSPDNRTKYVMRNSGTGLLGTQENRHPIISTTWGNNWPEYERSRYRRGTIRRSSQQSGWHASKYKDMGVHTRPLWGPPSSSTSGVQTLSGGVAGNDHNKIMKSPVLCAREFGEGNEEPAMGWNRGVAKETDRQTGRLLPSLKENFGQHISSDSERASLSQK